MKCPQCKSPEICRVARESLWQSLRAKLLGRWPYRCEACAYRFSLPMRSLPERRSKPVSNHRPPSFAGPEMAYRRNETRPTAKVVIQADDHVQLDSILLALNNAIASYQKPGRERVKM